MTRLERVADWVEKWNGIKILDAVVLGRSLMSARQLFCCSKRKVIWKNSLIWMKLRCYVQDYVNVKVNVTPGIPVQAQRKFNFGIRRWCVLNSTPLTLSPGKEQQCLLCGKLGGTQGLYGRAWRIESLLLLPPIFDPRTVQSVASRCTDYVIRVPSRNCGFPLIFTFSNFAFSKCNFRDVCCVY